MAFAAAMRMVVRVHDDTAVGRTDAEPTGTAGFADRDVFEFQVADLTDGRAAVDMYLADFAGRQAQQGVIAFLGHQLGNRTGGTDHLAAFADLQFHIVYQRTNGDVLQGQAVAGLDIGISAADDSVASLEAERCEDVAFSPSA